MVKIPEPASISDFDSVMDAHRVLLRRLLGKKITPLTSGGWNRFTLTAKGFVVLELDPRVLSL